MEISTIMADPNRYLTKEQVEVVISKGSNEEARLLMEVLFTAGPRIQEITGGVMKRTEAIRDELGNIIEKRPFTLASVGFLARNLYKGKKPTIIIPNLKRSSKKIEYKSVPIPFDTSRRIEAYIKKNRIRPNERIFPMGRKKAWRYVQKAGILAGIDLNPIKGQTKGIYVHPHIFRHSLGIHLTKMGLELSKIQAILGHASISSTGFYQRFHSTEIHDDYYKAMQGEKVK